MILTGYGIFSNTATTNSKMSCFLYIEQGLFTRSFMRLVEYNSHVVKDSAIGNLSIKDKNGDIHYFIVENSSNGYLYVINNEDFLDIIKQEGEISCYLSIGKYTTSTYSWKFKLDGFHNAFKHVFSNNDEVN